MSELQTTDRSHLIDQHAKLRALAYHLVRPQDAEDYVQDTFVTALSNAESKAASPRSPGPWLRQVLRNKVRADARRGRRWNELESLVPAGGDADRPDDHSAEAELAGALRDVLNDLDEPYRSALTERFYGERTAAEIAERAGIAPGTIRWRVHEGLRRMRQELDRRFGKRSHWYGAAVVLGGNETGAVTSATGAASMSKPSIIHFLLPVGAAAIGIACAAFSPPGDGASEPRDASEAKLAVAAAPSEESPQRIGADAVEDGEAAVEPARGSAVGSLTGSSPNLGATAAAATLDDPEMTRAEYEACAMDGIVAYNENYEAGAPDPDAVEYLVDAGSCFERAGIAGKAVHVHKTILSKHPDSRYVDESKLAMARLYHALTDVEAGLATPIGQECAAPILEEGGRVSGSEYIAAADCMFSGGALVAAALQYRELAVDAGGDFDVAANDKKMEYLRGALEDMIPKAEKLARDAASIEGKD